MLRQELSEKVYSFLQIVKYASGVIVLIVSTFLKVNVPDNIPLLSSVFGNCQRNGWWIIILFAFAGGLSQYLTDFLGSRSSWRIVQHVLNKYREEVFDNDNNTKNDAEYLHRITLFKHSKWRWGLVKWPWSGWLVPVARSGSTTKTKIQCFWASKERPNEAEGVAGQTWVSKREVKVFNLPDLNVGNPSETDIKEYAEKACVKKEWLDNRMRTRRRGPQYRSLLGICIEVKGVPWGVLVIDSRNPAPSRLKNPTRNSKLKAYEDILSRLLEKI